ncbi:hypothetical protein AA101099_2530 [Neoasaia chiangmaiensis NBRC 101099]|nr:hypothetical protein AA101099_2530 [Neoasaia chiangmaiensis NBRC 101099]GEN14393.1 hypothetical protein NCH01_08240 [Neoasaia chiangmaiensis]
MRAVEIPASQMQDARPQTRSVEAGQMDIGGQTRQAGAVEHAFGSFRKFRYQEGKRLSGGTVCDKASRIGTRSRVPLR